MRLNKAKHDFGEPISIEDARKRFPGAMADVNAENFGSDPAGYDVLFVRDGHLIMGNVLDGMYDEWDGKNWYEAESWEWENEE